MDELQRLVNVYRTRASSVNSKLDVLMDLERVRDPRVVPFLLKLLRDPDESEAVRIHIVKQLRSAGGLLVPADQPAVAKALVDVLTNPSTDDIRLQAALALSDFTHIEGVLSTLAGVALARAESIDLRYAAFTSVERAGPTPACLAVLGQIAADETLGDTARTTLSAWHVRLARSTREEKLDDRSNPLGR